MKMIILASLMSFSVMAGQITIGKKGLMPLLVKDISVTANLMPGPAPVPGMGSTKRVFTQIEIEVAACFPIHEETFRVDVVKKSVDTVALRVVTVLEPMVCGTPVPHRQSIRLDVQGVPAFAKIIMENPLLVDRQIAH